MAKKRKVTHRGPAEVASGQSLLGRRIVVTRARAQSGQLVERLEVLGADILILPTIVTTETADWEELDAALDRFAAYDWIVFTSANAVRYLISRLDQRSLDRAQTTRQARICAIGSATVRALAESGLQVHVIPETYDSEGLLSAIVAAAGGERKVAGMRFLLPRSNIARDVLSDGLSRLGALVEAVEVYQTCFPETDRTAVLLELTERRVDAITFTSPSTVNNFFAMVGADRAADILKDSLVACIGPVTAQAASERGLRNVVYPEEHNADALVQEIAKRFR